MPDFTDTSVLVTGGTRGIGRAVSTAFARNGARVAMVYRHNSEAAQEALSRLEGAGHHCLQADLSDPAAVQQVINDAIVLLGHIDVVVNNAGIGVYHSVEDSTYAEWQRAWLDTLNANLLAPANVIYWVARHMIERGGGRIVNISSRGAFRGEPIKPAYGASKAGLNALGQSLAVALAPHDIFVGTVAPGFVNTELAAERLNGPEGEAIRAQSPFNRVAEPEEVAHAVLFLASEGAEFTTGTIIDVNGASYLRS